MMKYKLIAYDLDGTFLDDKKNIPEINLEALKAADAAGIITVPASGRIYKGLPETIRRLPFTRYCITINGAYVYDALEDSPVYEAEIPLETALELCDYFAGLPVIYDCYRRGWGYMSERLYNTAEDFIPDKGALALIKNLRTPVPSLEENLRSTGLPVQKLQAFFKDPKLRLEVMEELEKTRPELKITSSVPNNIEINSIEATKGRALTELCCHLGIDLSETVTFGDGSNDITMLQAAGLGAAMENASDKVKASADTICGDNNGGGVGRKIFELLENN